MIVMCQWSFISGAKSSECKRTLMGKLIMEELAWVGVEGMCETSVFTAQLCCEPKTDLNNKKYIIHTCTQKWNLLAGGASPKGLCRGVASVCSTVNKEAQ